MSNRSVSYRPRFSVSSMARKSLPSHGLIKHPLREEADAVADKVVNRLKQPAPNEPTSPSNTGNSGSSGNSLHRKETPIASLIRRKCMSCEGEVAQPKLQIHRNEQMGYPEEEVQTKSILSRSAFSELAGQEEDEMDTNLNRKKKFSSPESLTRYQIFYPFLFLLQC